MANTAPGIAIDGQVAGARFFNGLIAILLENRLDLLDAEPISPAGKDPSVAVGTVARRLPANQEINAALIGENLLFDIAQFSRVTLIAGRQQGNRRVPGVRGEARREAVASRCPRCVT